MKSKIFIILLLAAYFPLVAIGQRTDHKSRKKVTITGFVTDANRNPVAGAIVLIDNANTNTFTNRKGFYKLKVRPDAVLITILTFNNTVAEAPIEGQRTINFTLKGTNYSQNNKPGKSETDKDINIGYGSVDRKNLTTPVSKLDVDENKNTPYMNIYEMIRGKVPGVEVNGKSIRIQGASSFYLSTEPLFVVDGMIVSSVDDISPFDVKSIEVLKGAAASIYGSRGANGVILIYLKGSSRKK
jgi:TonB-dependent SusC/RagA subfamily outer membrane receptor